MQAADRVFGVCFVDEEADTSLGSALAEHPQIYFRQDAKYLAGDFGLAADLLAYQAHQGFLAFPTHVREALQFFGYRRQCVGGSDQERKTAARSREKVHPVLMALEDLEDLS